MKSTSHSLLFSCEHAGNRIPSELSAHFTATQRTLRSHRGWDPGALQIAKQLSKHFAAPIFYSNVSRLIVDQNRPLQDPNLHSSFLKLDIDGLNGVLLNYYFPYQSAVTSAVQHLIKKGPVFHLSIHSFTPVFRGVRRTTEIGILFDDSVKSEIDLAQGLLHKLKIHFPNVHIRLNYPYNGADPGLTTTLRSKFRKKGYSGFELEFNQGWLKRLERNGKFKAMVRGVADALAELTPKRSY